MGKENSLQQTPAKEHLTRLLSNKINFPENTGKSVTLSIFRKSLKNYFMEILITPLI